MAELIIREAVLADAPAIHAIRAAIVADPYITFSTYVPTLEEIEEQIRTLEPYLVAEEAGVLLGYCYYWQFRSGPGYVHCVEHSIHLGPEARGRGAGRALMRALEARAKAVGVHVIVAGVGGGNAAGVAFHAACGFIETGRMPQVGRKGGQWHDLVLMQKEPGA